MTRTKLKREYIVDDAARKNCFKKRKKGILKKAAELSTLCDIQVAAIVCSPNESQIDVWPNHLGVQRVLAQFMKMAPAQQNQRMLDQESFTRNMIRKTNEKLSKQCKENREKEITEVMYQCLAGTQCPQNLVVPDLHDLDRILDMEIREIDEKITSLKNSQPSSSSQSAPPPLDAGISTLNEEELKPMEDRLTEEVPQWFLQWVNNGEEQFPFGGPKP